MLRGLRGQKVQMQTRIRWPKKGNRIETSQCPYVTRKITTAIQVWKAALFQRLSSLTQLATTTTATRRNKKRARPPPKKVTDPRHKSAGAVHALAHSPWLLMTQMARGSIPSFSLSGGCSPSTATPTTTTTTTTATTTVTDPQHHDTLLSRGLIAPPKFVSTNPLSNPTSRKRTRVPPAKRKAGLRSPVPATVFSMASSSTSTPLL